MSGHAKLAPSAAHRWMECPGSIALCEGIPDEDSSYAREGTFAHAVASHCLEHSISLDQMIGRTAADFAAPDDEELLELSEFTVDQDMVGHLTTYTEAVEEVLMAVPGASLRVEEKVHLFGIRKDIGGTADAIIHTPATKVLDVLDLKYGAGVLVDVVDNPQLKIYGLGALLTFPIFESTDTVRVHIVQPRHFMGGHTSQEFPASELVEWAHDVLVPAAEETEKPGASLASGDWCRFCPAKPTCPQLRATTMEHTQALFADTEMKTPAKTPPKPELLTVDDLAIALSAFPTIEQWIKAVREHAYKLVSSGSAIPGQKLVEKSAHRKWNNETEARDALVMLLDGNKVPFAPGKLVTPAQAEKLLPKMFRGLIMKLASTPKTGKTVLVPDSDKRLVYQPGSVFEDDTEPTNQD